MPRISKTMPVNAKLYRHFAIVVVVLTTCLAFMADDGNRAVIAEQAQAQQAKAVNRASQDRGNADDKVDGFHVRNGGRQNQRWGNNTSMMGVGIDNNFDGDPLELVEMEDGPSMPSTPPLPPSFVDGRPASELAAEEAGDGSGTLIGQAAAARQRRKHRTSMTQPSGDEIRQAVDAARERSGSETSEDDPI